MFSKDRVKDRIEKAIAHRYINRMEAEKRRKAMKRIKAAEDMESMVSRTDKKGVKVID